MVGPWSLAESWSPTTVRFAPAAPMFASAEELALSREPGELVWVLSPGGDENPAGADCVAEWEPSPGFGAVTPGTELVEGAFEGVFVVMLTSAN